MPSYFVLAVIGVRARRQVSYMKKLITLVRKDTTTFLIALLIAVILALAIDEVYQRYSVSQCTQRTVSRMSGLDTSSPGTAYKLLFKACMGKRGYEVN